MLNLMFPRICALAESTWTPRGQLDWSWYLSRLNLLRQRFDAMKLPYFWDPESAIALDVGRWKSGEPESHNGVIELSLKGKLNIAGSHQSTVPVRAYQIRAVATEEDPITSDPGEFRNSKLLQAARRHFGAWSAARERARTAPLK
jgi:hypothetical protein